MGGEATRPGDWCATLGIERPALEAVKDHREAIFYSLLIVALLERGEAMTLAEVARRFAAAGVGPYGRALRGLQRCKPGRAPVYRDGDRYALDPYDDELALWAFRLGLRPPRFEAALLPREEPPPLPGDETPLTVEELDEAWRDASLYSWSAQRLALSVLDAHGGSLPPAEVVSFVSARTQHHRLREETVGAGRRRCPILVGEGGRWELSPLAADFLGSARRAVRARIEIARRSPSRLLAPSVVTAWVEAEERRRAAHGRQLESMTRAVLVAFPVRAPRAVALLDVGRREIVTLIDEELPALPGRLAAYDLLAAENVRGLLRAVGFEPGGRRLAELGPPQKSWRLNRSGRTLRITTTLLVQGSCDISRPFGDRAKLAGYLARGERSRLRRRLESDVKSLYAYYEYGRLHAAVRLRWGFLDELIPAPWVHRDESRLLHLKQTALEEGRTLDVVVGCAPAWGEPWSRVRRATVVPDTSGWWPSLVDETGHEIHETAVQRARLTGTTGA